AFRAAPAPVRRRRGDGSPQPGRVMTEAVLSLGSNLGDRLGYLQLAVDGLGHRVRAVSPVYETEPWGVTDQPRFLNAVVLAADEAQIVRASCRERQLYGRLQD